MLQTLFHAWERRLASVTTDRVVRPFEWGLDWIPATATAARRPGRAGPARTASRVGRARHGGHRRLLHAAADARLHVVRSIGKTAIGLLTFPTALPTPHPANNTVSLPLVRSARGRGRAARGGPRAAAVERGRRRPRRVVPAAQLERPERAAPQPAVSRSAHAARAPSRRLHRQRERRADGAGVPAGRARRAARHRVARGAGLRAHRHPRHRASDRAWRC